MKDQTLKEKFYAFVETLPKRVGETPKSVIADFFLSEFRKEVEGMRKENSAPKWDAPKNQRVIYAHSRRDGYNTALKDLLTTLQAQLTLLKNER